MRKFDAVASKCNADGVVVFAANKKARRIIDAGFGDDPVSWRKIARSAPGDPIASPEYYALEFKRGPWVGLMLATVYREGLTASFWCEACRRYHVVDDQASEQLIWEGLAVAENAMPAHETRQ